MRDSASEQLRRGPARALYLLVALTTGLIVLGALVRAHEAGLACPDWPLCFGEVVPQMDLKVDLKVAFEWTHRAVAGGISLLFAGVLFRCARDRELWPRARGALLLAAGLLGLQILLGALTVWKLLAAWTVTSHLLTGNAFNAVLSVAARRAGGAAPRFPPASPTVRAVGVAALLLLVLQIALGGLVSSTFAGLACPDWPRCSGDAYLPSFSGSVGLHLAHRWNPVLLVTALLIVSFLARGVRGGHWWLAATLIALLQWAVGIANVVLGIPVEVTALHSGLAALLVLCETRALHESFLREE